MAFDGCVVSVSRYAFHGHVNCLLRKHDLLITVQGPYIVEMAAEAHSEVEYESALEAAEMKRSIVVSRKTSVADLEAGYNAAAAIASRIARGSVSFGLGTSIGKVAIPPEVCCDSWCYYV